MINKLKSDINAVAKTLDPVAFWPRIKHGSDTPVSDDYWRHIQGRRRKARRLTEQVVQELIKRNWVKRLNVLTIWTVFCLAGAGAYSQPVHEHGPFDTWFKSLRQSDDKASMCCGPDDQFDTNKYWPDPDVPGGFIVVTEPNHGRNSITIKVPPNKVNWQDVHSNLTGKGVIFLSMDDWSVKTVVYCFVPGMGV